MRLRRLPDFLLEKIINSYLQLDAEAAVYLTPLQGKIIRITAPDWRLQYDLLMTAQGVRLLAADEVTPHVIIKGGLADLLRAACARSADTAAFAALELQGDVDLAQQLQLCLQRLAVDWEEILARFTGDVAAHALGNQARRIAAWQGAVAGNLKRNLTEYLQEELRYVPTRVEVEDFCNEVSTLRHDAERLLARWQLYQQQNS